MKIETMVDKFRDEHKFSTPAQLELLEVIKDNLKIIDESVKALNIHVDESGLPYGVMKAHGALIPHPCYKMKAEAQKLLLSCFRQFDIKPEEIKKEKPKGLSALMKKAE